jgi:probable rRNA maturation factor
MSISLYKTVKSVGLPMKKIDDAVNTVLKKIKKTNKDISVNFVGEQRIKKLNYFYRKKNSPTDVLSFSAQEGFSLGDSTDWGDIFICVPYVKAQAKKRKISYKEECLRVLIHGVLHLAGYDHTTQKEEKVMFSIQEDCLKKVL